MKIVVFNLWSESPEQRKVFRKTAAIMSALMSCDNPSIRDAVVMSLTAVSLGSPKVNGRVTDSISYVVYNNPTVDDFISGFRANLDADYIHVSGNGRSWLDKGDGSKQAEISFLKGPLNVREELAGQLQRIPLKHTSRVFFEVCNGFDVALCLMKPSVGVMKQLFANTGMSIARIRDAPIFSMGYDDIKLKGLPGALCKYAENENALSERTKAELKAIVLIMLRINTDTDFDEVVNFCHLKLRD